MTAASYRAVEVALASKRDGWGILALGFLVGFVGLDEQMTWPQLLGTALVLGGVVLMTLKPKT